MGMGCTRVMERVFAAMGKLSEAPSVFISALDVPNAGVLWALPALLNSGLLRHTKGCFKLPKGFYGITHIFLLLAFMALARIKNNEKLRYSSAGEGGILLGLDRIPEVRTLRHKIKHLSETGEIKQWSSELSKEWMDKDLDVCGALYIDGHVRVYNGKNPLPKRYVSRQKLCMRGMSDYWLNDEQGRPFFVISTPFNSGLIKILRENIVPRLLKEVPHQPTQEELNANALLARFIIIFDREGYSPDFFKDMWDEHRIACMTYNKYPKEDWDKSEFEKRTGAGANGEEVEMLIAERGTLLGSSTKKIWVREIRKLTETGHQTAIVCTEYLAPVHSLAVRMFSRWCQENFFKYMIQNFGLDALTGYGRENVDETEKLINPKYRKIQAQIQSEAGKLGRKFRKFAEMTLSEIPDPEEIELYKEKKAKLVEDIESLEMSLENLKETRKKTDKHITVQDLHEEERFKVIAPKSKAFVDTIKMIAYRAETAMASVINKVMSHPDEARSLLREIYTQEADIIPDEEAGTLTVRLHHLANRVSDKAAWELSRHLNETDTIYPGSNLLMRYELVSK